MLRYFIELRTYIIGEDMKRFRLKRRVRSKIITIIFAMAFILSEFTASACFSPADPYAIEVVLNKPGVKYDLTKLAGMKGVSSVDHFSAYSAYAYKSHYDDRLIVVVSEQGLKYANVRAPSDEPMTVVSVKGLNLTPEQVSDNIEKVKNELGWDVETPSAPKGRGIVFIFTKMIDGAEVKVFLGVAELESCGEYTVKLGLLIRGVEEVDDELASKIKSEAGSLLDKIGLPELKKLLKTHMIKDALARKPPEQEKYIAVRIQVPLKQEVNTTTVHTCSIEYASEKFDISELKVEEARKLGWTVWVKRISEDNYMGFIMTKKLDEAKLSIEGKGRGGEAYLSLRVANLDELSSEILEEFRNAFKAIGLGEKLVDKCLFVKFQESTRSRFVPAYDISEEEVKNALKTELEWLSENGIITGLSKEDLEVILSVAKLGYAGWNSRLVWSNGKWVSYGFTDGAMVLRCVKAPLRIFFPEEETGDIGPLLLVLKRSSRIAYYRKESSEFHNH